MIKRSAILTLVGIASLVGITSYQDILTKKPVDQSLQFTKTYQHDSGYNLIGGPTGEVKPVDSGFGVKRGREIPEPSNATITQQLIKNFEYAYHRDTKLVDLPAHLQIKISPLMYMGVKGNQKPQQYAPKFVQYATGKDYLTDRQSFLFVQNGGKVASGNIVAGYGYIQTVRDVSSFVHKDRTELYVNLFHTLNEAKVPRKLKGFFSGGEPLFIIALCESVKETFQHTRYTKYKHNRIRPEELAGRVEFGLSLPSGFNYTGFITHPSVAYSKSKYGTYLLPISYPEGSPAHPDYTQGHTALAIAGIETLKRFFDTTYLIDELVIVNGVPTPTGTKITVDESLNRIRDMIGMGRIMNGVHFEDSFVNAVSVITEIVNKKLDTILK